MSVVETAPHSEALFVLVEGGHGHKQKNGHCVPTIRDSIDGLCRYLNITRLQADVLFTN